MKAFGYIERVVIFDFFLRKIPFLHHACATCFEQPSNIKAMVFVHFPDHKIHWIHTYRKYPPVMFLQPDIECWSEAWTWTLSLSKQRYHDTISLSLIDNPSHASPIPSSSKSSWLGFAVLAQLSSESIMPSSSESSQTSPIPSPSVSMNSVGSNGKASFESGIPSLSESQSALSPIPSPSPLPFFLFYKSMGIVDIKI